jgi:hypothetical protein
MSTGEWVQVEILTSSLIELKFVTVNLNTSKQPLHKRRCGNLYKLELLCKERIDYSKLYPKAFEKCSILFKIKEGKISTAGILSIFRGLKFFPDAEIGQKGAFCRGLGKGGTE